MRLFHVSEEPDITIFMPRLPKRQDLDPNTGLIWAIDEERLPNFLTPRDCPRVTYHIGSQTTDLDKKRFFSSSGISHAIVLESKWFHIIQDTTLYLYEFNTKDFVLQDSIAGYYVTTQTQHPIKKHIITDLIGELMKRNVEIRFIDSLCEIADEVKSSSLNWSLCRMGNATQHSEPNTKTHI